MNKVLIVDDTSYIRESIKALLGEKSIESVDAGNARDAIALLKQDSGFDAVITDLVMPGISGLDLINFIKAHYPSMAVLAISGGGNIIEENSLLSKAVKSADFALKKPFTPEDFYKAIDKIRKDAN